MSGLAFQAEAPPLRADAGGTVRVGETRLTLDLIVEQYENGMTPEDLVRAYDALALTDAYAVIAYYLRHRDEVRAYLAGRAVEAWDLRQEIEARGPRPSRAALLARRGEREGSDAPASE
ncbi:hypothetical protein OJF2_36490 [Aquisphaera giovannonii]|uniref:DUF433 domain-containing protein n=1 Tax=Aquisphaera giovannonii TaxID=406548 RepID=A0A5B9W4B5_9BACT|nr:DUF433 domain-containing protein [Aquisphaera giovannonii]QEH35104.1 hypothetical protein OJF2_36490 [Aquisphaera giovannonii]